MNEQQNVNNNPKPKKKRSFWWLKLLFMLVLVAAGVIGGMMLASRQTPGQLMDEFMGLNVIEPYVAATAPVTESQPPVIEYKPKPTKAPVEIVSPEQKESETLPEISAAPEVSAEPQTGAESELTAEPSPSTLPTFASDGEPHAAAPAEIISPAMGADGSPIGIEAALEAALKHAGVDKDEAIIYSVSRERDDGTVYYEVEFAHNGKEYDYEVNAFTGVVEGWKTVREKNYAPAAAANAPATESAAQTDYVSREDALATALFHAGYEQHETTDLKVSLEIEKNKVVYDVEFWAEGYDYDYKVDASSGLVIMVEKERD